MRFVPWMLGLGLATQGFALAPWKGQQKAVVLLVEWSNAPATVSREDVVDTFFSETEGAFSIKQFFAENARGKFDLTGDVLDWRRSDVSWDPARGCRLNEIVSNAWNVFSADLDQSKYDSDGNGKIDNLFIVHSGRIGSDRVGPECTFTTSSHADYSVVFQSQGIGSIGSAIPIGFYIHEGGHGYYSLPDLYGSHYHGRYGIGMWGMMGLGAWGVSNDIPAEDLFRFPAHFEPYSKVRIGWVTPRKISTTQRDVVIQRVEETNDIVVVPASISSSYYLEYRSPMSFSAGHKGHGLLIWKNYTIIQADNRDDINHGNDLGRRPLPPISENFGDASDPFPGSDNVQSYSDKSAGITFENIRQFDDHVVLDIVINQSVDAAFEKALEWEAFDGVERL